MDLALAFEDSQPFKLTVDQYQALDEAGAFEDNPRIELIEGMIVCMNSQRLSHMLLSNELGFRFRETLSALRSPYRAFVGPTVAMPPHNAPDPDIAITTVPKGARYLPVEAAALLVEVSRTTLRRDMKMKHGIYARAGVPEYWVIDVKKLVVHRFWRPTDGEYRQEPPIPLAGPLASLTIPELVVDGTGIL